MVKWLLLFRVLERKLPEMVKKIARYSTNTQAIKSATWQVVLRTTMLQIVIHTIIITAIILSSKFVLPLVESSKFGMLFNYHYYYYFPFLWALPCAVLPLKKWKSYVKR
jgi:CPA2 family monovalent cation:H+ antiporter-2